MKKVRYFSFSLNLIILLLTVGLLSCGGGGGGGTASPGVPAPYIYAEIISLPSSTLFPGIQNVYVFVQDDTDGALIETAAVLVNGVTITYDNASLGYAGSVAISPGSSVHMTVTVSGQSYDVTSSQFSDYPVITSPTSDALWSASRGHVVLWTGGWPTTGATYGLGVLDSADPNGNLLWPSSGYLQDIPISSTSFTIPAYSLTTGERIVLAGIWREDAIPSAALGSSIVIGGFNATPINLINSSSDILTSITVWPATPQVEKGHTIQMEAYGQFDDGSTQNLSDLVDWSSSDASVVSISNSGLATGSSIGPATITATFGAFSASTVVRTTVAYTVSQLWGPANTVFTYTAIGDLNGDGMNDVVVTDESSAHIYLSKTYAYGTYIYLSQTLTTELHLRGIAIKDVNNDGYADLIVSGNSTTALSGAFGRVAVFLQDPSTHTLGAPEYHALSINDVGAPDVADLNSDGLADIVTVGKGTDGSDVISLLFQKGDGSLLTEATYTAASVYALGTSYPEVHEADMNGDGKNDIVLRSGVAEIAVIKQTTPGNFSATPDRYAVDTKISASFDSFALGDLNGDGRTDIAIAAMYNLGAMNMFLQNNNGTLDSIILQKGTIPAGKEIDVADMNGDGLNDIISIYPWDGTMRIYYQAEDHSFMSPRLLPRIMGCEPQVRQAVSIGDISNDGLPDIVVSGQRYVVSCPAADAAFSEYKSSP